MTEPTTEELVGWLPESMWMPLVRRVRAGERDDDIIRRLCSALELETGALLLCNARATSAEATITTQAQRLSDLEGKLGEARKAQDAWDWLASRINLELDWDEIDEGEAAWRVHRVSGGRNDREWELVAARSTPLAAVQAARIASEALKLKASGGGEEGSVGRQTNGGPHCADAQARPTGGNS